MKALLYADWRTVAKDVAKYAICAIVIGAVFVLSEDLSDPTAIADDIETAIMSCTTFYFCTFFLFSTFSADGASGWEVARLALPVTRRDVVGARYAFLALTALGGIVVGAVLGALGTVVCEVSNHIGNTVTLVRPVDLLVGCLLIMGVALVLMAIELPIFFKLGHDQARPFVTIPFLLPLLLLLDPVKDLFAAMGNPEHVASVVASPAGALALLVVGVVVYFASYRLAVGLYQRRDL